MDNPIDFYYVEATVYLNHFWTFSVYPVYRDMRLIWTSQDARNFRPEQRRYTLEEANRLAHKLWAIRNPKWFVWLKGDHYQKQYRSRWDSGYFDPVI